MESERKWSEELKRFRNGLCILHSIDRHDLVKAGIIHEAAGREVYEGSEVIERANRIWRRFSEDPVDWFLRADDDGAARVWKIVESRQPRAALAAARQE